MAARIRNPLEPVATVVTLLLVFAGFGTIFGVVAGVFGFGGIMGFGDSSVLVDVHEVSDGSQLQLTSWSPHANVETTNIGYQFFEPHPDIAQRILYTMTVLPTAILFVGALLLIHQLLRGAGRDGIYTVASATRLRNLSWFLLLGSLAKSVVELLAANRLLATMVTDDVGWVGPVRWHLPLATLLIAIGLLSASRIMRIGADMQDEIQGTV